MYRVIARGPGLEDRFRPQLHSNASKERENNHGRFVQLLTNSKS